MSLHFSRLILERYKAFQQPCEIEVRPLTILVGANNAGKSALARAVPFLAGGLRANDPIPGSARLPLESFGLTHGTSFEDLIAGRSVHGSIRMNASFRSDGQELALTAEVQNVVSPGEETQQIVMQWGLGIAGGDRINIKRSGLDSDEHQIKVSQQGRKREYRSRIRWAGLLPSLDERYPWISESKWFRETLIALPRWAQGVRYLKSPRVIVDSPFRTPTTRPPSLSASGYEAPLMLATSDELLREVQVWFLDTFGVKLDVRHQGNTSVLEVLQTPGHIPVSIAQAGQGLSHVLPVVIQSITAAEAGAGVDILEHPEAELHPRAHGGIADLIVSRLPGHERPLIVETHSEVLLLRIRRNVVEEKLNRDDVAIYWIGRNEEAESATIRKVEIDANGEVINWPEGVFQEDYEEVVAIRREARRRAKQ